MRIAVTICIRDLQSPLLTLKTFSSLAFFFYWSPSANVHFGRRVLQDSKRQEFEIRLFATCVVLSAQCAFYR